MLFDIFTYRSTILFRVYFSRCSYNLCKLCALFRSSVAAVSHYQQSLVFLCLSRVSYCISFHGMLRLSPFLTLHSSTSLLKHKKDTSHLYIVFMWMQNYITYKCISSIKRWMLIYETVSITFKMQANMNKEMKIPQILPRKGKLILCIDVRV